MNNNYDQLYQCHSCGATCTAREMWSVYPNEVIPYCPHCDESDNMWQVDTTLPEAKCPIPQEDWVLHIIDTSELKEKRYNLKEA